MNAHIGAFCRMYNDYGRIKRDRREMNLNSLNFPEFYPRIDDGSGLKESLTKEDQVTAKAALLEGARYERQCAETIAHEIIEELTIVGGREEAAIAANLKVYLGAAQFFSDVYLF